MTEKKKTEGLPKTMLSGVGADHAGLTTVLVSGMIEVSGHVRFGDGTDIDTTINETDTVLRPDGDGVHKFIWAGSKRRGVDRRTIHELRDRYWQDTVCYIPNLCGMCPVCWLYGFTGTTTKDKSSPIKNINAKSRILYATSVSVETVEQGQARHSRNQVDEKTQTTAGEAGIHKEQFVVAGVHFPIYTAAVQVLNWELGVFAHGLLENLNSNRYTAASRAQGGMRWAEFENDEPVLIVDESPDGIFPLSVPKVPGWESDYLQALAVFASAKDGYASNPKESKALEDSGNLGESDSSDDEEGAHTDSQDEQVSSLRELGLTVNSGKGSITVKRDDTVLMTRYYGQQALDYLRRRQLDWRAYLKKLKSGEFWKNVESYKEKVVEGVSSGG